MFKAKQMATPDTNTPCCLLNQATSRQKSTSPFPLDRLKRLKVEQIQHDAPPLPAFTPALISIIIIEQTEIHLTNNLLPHGFVTPHHRPPPLFIKYQSFLI